MKWAVEIEDMTVAYDMHPVLWDVDMKGAARGIGRRTRA